MTLGSGTTKPADGQVTASSLEKLSFFLRLLGPLTPHRKGVTILLIASGVLCSLLELLGITLIVILLRLVGDAGFSNETDGIIGELIVSMKSLFGGSNTAVAAGIFALICFQVTLQAWNGALTASIGQRLNEEVRNRLHWVLLHVAYDIFLTRNRGELLDVIATQSFTVSSAFNASIRLAVNFGTILIFLVVLFISSFEIAIAALFAFFLFSMLVRYLSRKGASLAEQKVSAGQQMSTVILRTLQGMRTIRSFNMEEFQQSQMKVASRRQTQILIRQSVVHSVISPLAELGSIALLLAIVTLAPLFDISFSVTLTSAALLYRIQPRLREIDWLLVELDNLKISLEQILRYYSLAPGLDGGGVSDVPESGEIVFRNVRVCYPNRNHAVLEGLSFSIKADEHVALVGPSGSGKTTIVNLLLRMCEIDHGSITYSDFPIGKISKDVWLQKISIAGQDVELIEGTVRDNILLANPKATSDEIAAIIKLAELDAVIEDLPHGLETWVGDYGQHLSGGQRQRIGIARALLRKPVLLVLDEATSALDEDLELRVISNIREHRKGAAILVITHNMQIASSLQRVLDIGSSQNQEQKD